MPSYAGPNPSTHVRALHLFGLSNRRRMARRKIGKAIQRKQRKAWYLNKTRYQDRAFLLTRRGTSRVLLGSPVPTHTPKTASYGALLHRFRGLKRSAIYALTPFRRHRLTTEGEKATWVNSNATKRQPRASPCLPNVTTVSIHCLTAPTNIYKVKPDYSPTCSKNGSLGRTTRSMS